MTDDELEQAIGAKVDWHHGPKDDLLPWDQDMRPAVTGVWIGKDTTMWVTNGSSTSLVNYCPVCGQESEHHATQRAFDRLREQGFVYSGKEGTQV